MVMKALILLILFAAPAFAWTPPAGYEADFEGARECRPVEGRKLWVGGKGYYLQANLFWTNQSGLLDDDAVSVVEFDDNSLDTLSTFAALCKA
jgi:hypothetical protein